MEPEDLIGASLAGVGLGWTVCLIASVGALVMARYGHPSKEAATDRLLALSEGTSTEIGRSATSARSA
jgi:hypothetical protein